MLYKIGWRSFLQQFRNYVVYFVCMMTAVMIFYSFSAMMNDRLLTQRVQQDIRIDGVLGFGSTIVAVVVLFFYAKCQSFLLESTAKRDQCLSAPGFAQSKVKLATAERNVPPKSFFPCCGHFHGDYILEIFLNDLDSSDGTIHH